MDALRPKLTGTTRVWGPTLAACSGMAAQSATRLRTHAERGCDRTSGGYWIVRIFRSFTIWMRAFMKSALGVRI